MSAGRPLSTAFAAVAGLDGRSVDPARAPAFVDAASAPGGDLEAWLAARLAEARATWPEFHLPDEAFVRYVAERAYEGLDQLRTADLYVSCGCARGDVRAITALEARYFPPIDAALSRMRLGEERLHDVKQGLRRLLFVGDEASPPRIVEYTGRGELRGWLRVTAVRAALKVLRRDRREQPVEEIDEDAMLGGGAAADPELLYVKATSRAQFKAAFQGALDSLDDRERLLLRQHVVDDLSIDEIGALYQVHRATAARWLTRAREALLERTRANLIHGGGLSPDECDSLLRMVHSQLDVTIRRRLEQVPYPSSGGR